jgi:cytoskeletal protein RodZ
MVMRTSGNLLKEARLNKGLTKKELEEITHIKASFIDAIERAKWDELPHFNILVGFVKSLSHFLDVDENQAVSLFRREYPPVLSQRSEKQKEVKEIKNKFTWGPRLTFLTGIIIILLIVFGYLGFQYRKFNMPPTLIVNNLVDGQTVTNTTLEVDGKTDPDATIIVNNQPIVVNNDGSFTAQVDVSNNKLHQFIVK